jgi:hypothetical protein
LKVDEIERSFRGYLYRRFTRPKRKIAQAQEPKPEDPAADQAAGTNRAALQGLTGTTAPKHDDSKYLKRY